MMDPARASDNLEKKPHLPGTVVYLDDVDVAAALATETEVPMDPEVARRLKSVHRQGTWDSSS